MLYNITAEAISAVFLVLIYTAFRGKNKADRHKDKMQNRLYELCIVALLLTTLSDVCASVLFTHLDNNLALRFATVCNTVTYAAIALLPLAFLAFFGSFLHPEWDGKKLAQRILLFSIPAWPVLALVLTNHYTHLFFSISADKGYRYGPWLWLVYAEVTVYCCLAFVMAMMYRHKYTRDVQLALFAFPVSTVASVVLQILLPEIPLTGTCLSVAILYMYSSMNNWRAACDELTGVYTRQTLQYQMQKQLAKHTHFYMAVVSMDNFKSVNRRYGTLFGDKILQKIGHWLTEKYDDVYRFSGDSFAVCFARTADITAIHDALHEIQSYVLLPWQIDGILCNTQATIIVLDSEEMPENATGFMQMAEAAVLQIKQEKRGEIMYCDSVMRQSIARHSEVVEAVRRAVEAQSFTVMLQPVYDARTKSFPLFEALARLEDLLLGSISPGEFIPVAEAYHLVESVDFCVLDKVCALLEKTENDEIRPQGISVNFSPLLFKSADLVDKVKAVMEKYTFTRSRLRIELIESTLVESREAVESIMDTLRSAGVHFYLDDFGTGFSNLARVTRLQVDVIKIDKSMLYEAESSVYCGTVLESLARAFCEHGREIIWEGVETQAQSDLVTSMGGHYMQGYLYAKPMPMEQAIALQKQA